MEDKKINILYEEDGFIYIKEYNNEGILIFEGDCLDGQKNGYGREYNIFGGLLFEGYYKYN